MTLYPCRGAKNLVVEQAHIHNCQILENRSLNPCTDDINPKWLSLTTATQMNRHAKQIRQISIHPGFPDLVVKPTAIALKLHQKLRPSQFHTTAPQVLRQFLTCIAFS